MQSISRSFGRVRALSDVSFAAWPGTVHALLGENGAGKTTLMNVAFGLLRPDSGEIVFDGQPVGRMTPQRAMRLGIGMVHQHFKLVDEFTVAENIALGSPDHAQAIGGGKTRLKKLIEETGLEVDPAARTGQLPVGLRQRVEILKALFRQIKLLILDEPTAVLTPQETSELFDAIQRLKASGTSIVIITHKLREAIEISDTVTVLRAGRVTLETSASEISESALVMAMVGRPVEEISRTPRKQGATVTVLELREVVLPGYSQHANISLKLREGEIVGIAGVQGNGQQELADVLAGVAKPDIGSIWLNGENVTRISAAGRLVRGLAHVPEDRQNQALLLDFSLRENVLLSQWPRQEFHRGPILNTKALNTVTDTIIHDYGVRGVDTSTVARALSGGNQQRMVVGRQLSAKPKVLIAFDPTTGLDIGARDYVHRRILEHRDAGGTTVLISTDLDEIVQLSDRVCVLYEGRLVTGLPPRPSIEEIGAAMATGAADGHAVAGHSFPEPSAP